MFQTAWGSLTEDEQKAMKYAHFSWPGKSEHALPNQEELIESATEKLKKAGIDVGNLSQYFEA